MMFFGVAAGVGAAAAGLSSEPQAAVASTPIRAAARIVFRMGASSLLQASRYGAP